MGSHNPMSDPERPQTPPPVMVEGKPRATAPLRVDGELTFFLQNMTNLFNPHRPPLLCLQSKPSGQQSLARRLQNTLSLAWYEQSHLLNQSSYISRR